MFRYDDDPVIPKKVNKIEAYDNQVECQTVEDLMNIKNNRKALIYESLIIRYKHLNFFLNKFDDYVVDT